MNLKEILTKCECLEKDLRNRKQMIDNDFRVFLGSDNKENYSLAKTFVKLIRYVQNSAGITRYSNWPNIEIFPSKNLVKSQFSIDLQNKGFVIDDKEENDDFDFAEEIINRNGEIEFLTAPFIQIGKLTANMYGPRQERFSCAPSDRHLNSHRKIKKAIESLVDSDDVKFTNFQLAVRAVITSKFCIRCLIQILQTLNDEPHKIRKFVTKIGKGILCRKSLRNEDGVPFEEDFFEENEVFREKANDFITPGIDVTKNDGLELIIPPPLPYKTVVAEVKISKTTVGTQTVDDDFSLKNEELPNIDRIKQFLPSRSFLEPTDLMKNLFNLYPEEEEDAEMSSSGEDDGEDEEAEESEEEGALVDDESDIDEEDEEESDEENIEQAEGQRNEKKKTKTVADRKLEDERIAGVTRFYSIKKEAPNINEINRKEREEADKIIRNNLKKLEENQKVQNNNEYLDGLGSVEVENFSGENENFVFNTSFGPCESFEQLNDNFIKDQEENIPATTTPILAPKNEEDDDVTFLMEVKTPIKVQVNDRVFEEKPFSLMKKRSAIYLESFVNPNRKRIRKNRNDEDDDDVITID